MASSARHVAIELLGGFVVHIEGREVGEGDWRGRRAAELVQLLALAEGHQVLRDQAIDALWPQLDAEAGAANLRKAAHHARATVGERDAVVLQGGRVQLFPGWSVVTDVDEVLRLVGEGSAGGDDAAARALQLCRGELLPGARYEEWAEGPRARLRAVRLDLLRATGDWQRVVELEPTDEAAHQALMREAVDRGARAEAIRWYGRLRSALALELGVLPSEATEELYRASVGGLDVAIPELVGRHVERATVTALLQAAGPDRVSCVVVRGPAGIGKSAFCREVGRVARAEGWGEVGVAITETGEPFGPIRSLVEQLVVASQGVLDAVGPLARAVLAALTPMAGPAAALEGPLSRHQIVGALRRLLVVSCPERPVLVVVDDAHVADEASIEALLHLVTPSSPILVVLACRPEAGNRALERGVTRLTRAGRAAVIDLEPLDTEDAAELVRRAADRALTTEVVTRVVDLAAGNPFAAIELARSTAPGSSTLPPNVREAITARLVDLDDDVVAVLQRLALASDDLDSATVVALTGSAEAEAFAVLDVALDAGVLVVADGRYRFRHDLVRQALVEGVTPHDRLAVHRDAARRLAVVGAPPATIARHWLAGGRPDAAVEPLIASAQQAMGVGAFDDAIAALDLALRSAPKHTVALRLRAECLDVTGDVGVLAAYDAAIAEAGADEVADLRAKRALAQLKQGDPPGAVRSLEGVVPTSVDARLAEALTFAGAAALGFIDPALGTQKAAECRRLALAAGDTAAIVVASWAQAAAAHARGQLRDSVVADLQETHDVPQLAVRVFDGQLCVTQRLLYGARPYDDVIEFADSLAAEGARLGAARGHAFGVTLRGEAELLSGRLDDAEVHLREGARLHRAIGGAVGEALALQRLAELALQRGDRPKATALLDEALDLAQVTDIGFHLLDRIYGTRIALAGPEEALFVVEESEQSVRGALETCPGCRITFAVPAAIAAADAGDLDRARSYADAAEFLAHVVMRLPAWDAAYEEVLAHIAEAEGDLAGARTHLAAAAEGFAAAGHPLDAERASRSPG